MVTTINTKKQKRA